MDVLITQLPHTLIGWLTLLVAFGLSVVSAILLYRRFSNGESDRLIDILQGTVEELEKKVNKQDDDIKSLTKKVEMLQTTNETLTAVLQGRDEQTQRFYRNAEDAMKTGKETNDLVKGLVQAVTHLTQAIEGNMVGNQPARG